jgi:hypothetical protein
MNPTQSLSACLSAIVCYCGMEAGPQSVSENNDVQFFTPCCRKFIYGGGSQRRTQSIRRVRLGFGFGRFHTSWIDGITLPVEAVIVVH